MKINFKKLFKSASCCLALFLCFSSAKYFCVPNSVFSITENYADKLIKTHHGDYLKVIKIIEDENKDYEKQLKKETNLGKIAILTFKILIGEKALIYVENKKNRPPIIV